MDLALDHIEFREFRKLGNRSGKGGESGGELVLLTLKYGGFHPDLREGGKRDKMKC